MFVIATRSFRSWGHVSAQKSGQLLISTDSSFPFHVHEVTPYAIEVIERSVAVRSRYGLEPWFPPDRRQMRVSFPVAFERSESDVLSGFSSSHSVSWLPHFTRGPPQQGQLRSSPGPIADHGHHPPLRSRRPTMTELLGLPVRAQAQFKRRRSSTCIHFPAANRLADIDRPSCCGPCRGSAASSLPKARSNA